MQNSILIIYLVQQIIQALVEIMEVKKNDHPPCLHAYLDLINVSANLLKTWIKYKAWHILCVYNYAVHDIRNFLVSMFLLLTAKAFSDILPVCILCLWGNYFQKGQRAPFPKG